LGKWSQEVALHEPEDDHRFHVSAMAPHTRRQKASGLSPKGENVDATAAFAQDACLAVASACGAVDTVISFFLRLRASSTSAAAPNTDLAPPDKNGVQPVWGEGDLRKDQYSFCDPSWHPI